MTIQEINKISSQKKAVTNQRYTDEKGNQYIGLSNGRVRLITNAVLVNYNQSQNNPESVQDNLETLNETNQQVNGSAVFTYDSSGNVVKKELYSDSSLSILIQTKDFIYDSNGTLTSFTISDNTGVKTKTLTYDSNDNLTELIIT